MVSAEARLAAIRRDFSRTRAGNPERKKYPLYLKRMVRQAIKAGITRQDVMLATGVDETTFASVLGAAKSSGATKHDVPQFRNLEIVNDSRPSTVCMFIGNDLRLEFPAELFSIELISRLRGAA